jgi:hypothetical protein
MLRPASRIPWLVAAMSIAVSADIAFAPSAFADLSDNLRSAVSAERGACGPLHSEPIVEKVADAINRSVRDYQANASAGAQPIDDPAPGLKALNYSGNKSKLLRGWGKTEAAAIKQVLIENIAVIEGPPVTQDCGFKDYGASVLFDEQFGYFTSVVLAGQ